MSRPGGLRQIEARLVVLSFRRNSREEQGIVSEGSQLRTSSWDGEQHIGRSTGGGREGLRQRPPLEELVR
jgi:hypothetical protein